MFLELSAILVVIFFAPSLIPEKHWLRFYVCYLTYAVHGCFLPLVFLPLIPISLKLYSRVLLGVATLGCRLMGVRWEIRNKHNFKKYKRGILIANHQSVIDVTGIMFLNDGFDNVTGIAKKELSYIPPLALVFWALGVISIDRKKSKEAMTVMQEAVARNKNKRILIFPEGTRNQAGDDLLQFKRGAFRLAVDMKVPIIPVVFSPYYFIKSRKHFRKGKVILSCLEPVETDELSAGDVENLMNRTRELMQEEFFKLSDEVGGDNNNKAVNKIKTSNK